MSNSGVELYNNLNDVTVKAIEGSNHMVQWDELGRTASGIIKWIAEKELVQ